MLMCNNQLQMNNAASILSEYFGFRDFVMETVNEGNLNYSYRVTINNQTLFVKLFSNRLSHRKKNYRDLHRRYEMEKYVLSKCNKAGLPTPKLVDSINEHEIVVQENLEGESLMNCFLNKEEPETILFALGMWIGGFHNIFEIQEQKKQTLYDEYYFLRTNNNRFNTNTVKRFIELLKIVKFSKKVLSRSDCHFGNFIISNSMLFGIDFELCLYQPPAIDLASIFVSYLDLKERALSSPEGIDDTLHMLDYHHLLEGYQEATGENYNVEFDAYIAAVLLKKYTKTNRKKYMDYLVKLGNCVVGS